MKETLSQKRLVDSLVKNKKSMREYCAEKEETTTCHACKQAKRLLLG